MDFFALENNYIFIKEVLKLVLERIRIAKS